jgi:hypothetical protein
MAYSLLQLRSMFDSNRVRWTVIAVIMLGVCRDGRAQTDNRLAVGMSVTARAANSSDAGGSADVGFELRLGPAKAGWAWQNSFFGWFDTDVQETVPTRTIPLGDLRVRPLMAGYGYTWIRGRAAITADLAGGYSLNSFTLDPAALADYSQRLGATRIDSKATNCFVLKPEVQVWYDVNSRFGLKLEGGYLIARPSVVITSSLGEDDRPVRADTLLVTIGVVFSIF